MSGPFVNALDPDAPKPRKTPLRLTASRNFLSTGKVGRVRVADFALFGQSVLLDPDHIFRGITEAMPLLNPVAGDDEGLAYVKRLPMRHRESSQGNLYQEATRGSETFIVYVYGEGVIQASRFEDCDSQGRPVGWETRFREHVYTAERLRSA